MSTLTRERINEIANKAIDLIKAEVGNDLELVTLVKSAVSDQIYIENELADIHD